MKYFHVAKERRVVAQDEPSIAADKPKATKKVPNPAPRGWIVSMRQESMSAEVGPGSIMLQDWYSAARDSEEQAMIWFRNAKCVDKEHEVAQDVYDQMYAEYEAIWDMKHRVE